MPLVTCTASANSVLASCVPPVARASAYLANPSGPSEGAFASKAGSLSSLAQSQPATFACECPEWSSCVPPVAGTIASLDNYSELSNTASAASASKVGSLSSLEQLPPPARACESVAIPPFAPQPNTQPPALLGQLGRQGLPLSRTCEPRQFSYNLRSLQFFRSLKYLLGSSRSWRLLQDAAEGSAGTPASTGSFMS